MAIYSMEGTEEKCYPNSTVLINKLNIQNQGELDDIEKAYVLLKLPIFVSPSSGRTYKLRFLLV